MAAAPTLARNRSFMLLWIGQSVSQVGNQFTGLALPLIAVLALHADSGEMGLLGAMGTLPFLLFGLLVGVWVDRHRKRPILIAGDLGRGIIVITIAGLALAGLLSILQLYAFGFLVGVLTVFFDISYQAYLPAVVERKQLVGANTRLEASNSIAAVGGPLLAGYVIQVLSAPFAMIFDGLTFLFSTATLVSIRKPEALPDPKERRSILHEIREGLGVVFGDRRLWSIAGCTGTSNFASGAIFNALFVLYAVRQLGMSAGTIGIAFGAGAIGGIVGAFTASLVAGRLGVGRAIIASALIASIGIVLIPLATPATAVLFLTVSNAVTFYGVVVYNVNQLSLRQGLVPLRLQGRLNATIRFLVWGTLPVGSVVGGILAGIIGLQPTMAVMVAVAWLALPWVVFSPVRAIRTMPEPMA